MSPEGIVAIIISVITGSFGVIGIYIANRNKQETAAISKVLGNTKTPVDSLDQVLKALQDEMRQSNHRHTLEIERLEARHISEIAAIEARHTRERDYLQGEIDELRDQLDERDGIKVAHELKK